MRKILFVICLFVVNSCIWNDIEHPNNRKNNSFPYKGDGTEIDIYLIKPEVAKGTKPPGEIGKNDIESSPWLSHSEIEFFDWSAKAFYLKNEKTKNSLAGRYFVVTANQKPFFTGFFYSGYMSFIPNMKIILADDWRRTSKQIVILQSFIRDTNEQKSNSSEFRRVMENTGLLKEGINVELTQVNKINTTSLTYSFKVTNLDNEDIYIMDPEKMGSSRFHYYTNGVYLWKENKYFGASGFEYTPSDKIETGWFFRLPPGQSMSRTLKLNGYKDLPDGKVMASFSFPGALLNENENWKINNGRIWIGNFESEKELVLK